MKPVAFMTRVLPNYWLLKFKLDTGSTPSFQIGAGQSLSENDIRVIRSTFELFTTVSFNGNNYDCQ